MNAARQNEQSIFHTFFKYVSSNVLGMIGFSCYILADVFFIARGIGADALAALNLTLPAYNLMNGIGLMRSRPLLAFIDTPGQRYTPHCFYTCSAFGRSLRTFLLLCGSILFRRDFRHTRRRSRHDRLRLRLHPHTASLLPALSRKQSSSLFCEKRRSSQTFYGGNAYRKSCQHCTGLYFYLSAWHGNGRSRHCDCNCSCDQYAHHVCPFYKEKQPVSYYKNTAVIKTRR